MSDVLLRWDLRTPADLATTWRAFSNTDRFNRAAGLGFSFREEPRPDGTVARTGTARQLGLELRWEELPFEIHAPTGFRNTRLFASGPVERLETSVALAERADGTAATYTVAFRPRHLLFRPVVLLVARSARSGLDRTLKRLLLSLEGKAALDPPPPLAPHARERLRAWARRSAVGAAIERLLTNAPLDVQDRLRPLQVAATERLTEAVAVAGFLDGVREGVLEMRWELLCPSCRAPKDLAPRLGDGPAVVHCPSCAIRYDATFPETLAVTFRPSPTVRKFSVPVDCLLSPSRTPHVLAQATIDADAEVVFEADLVPGGYRLDARPATGSAAIEVRAGLPAHDVALDLEPDGLRPRAIRLAPGRRRVAIRNRTGRTALVVLERRWLPPYTLTAGRLVESAEARALLPADALAPGVAVTVARRAVVAVAGIPDGTRTEPALLAAARGAAAAWTGQGTAVLAFEAVADALGALATLAGLPGLSAGLAVGAVAAIDRPDGARIPSGSTVERALDVQRVVGLGRIAVHPDDKGDADLLAALAAHGATARDPGPVAPLFLLFREVRDARNERIAAAQAPALCGAWALEGEIGAGAHGRVFAARHVRSGRPAVVKVLRPELSEDPEASQRFFAEARFTARLDHPNVVRLYDWGQTVEGRLWMALERLEGEPLDQRLQRGVLSPDEARRVALDVLDALAAAHAGGILHRDIKPANLFLLRDGTVKILDFGVAQRLGDDEGGDLVLPGTPEYMSPEQVEADPLDGRSDLYALGVVLYECLAGRLPFEGDQAFLLAMQRVLVPPRPLGEVAPGVPPPLASVVMRALEVDPPRRWSDAGAMRNAIVSG